MQQPKGIIRMAIDTVDTRKSIMSLVTSSPTGEGRLPCVPTELHIIAVRFVHGQSIARVFGKMVGWLAEFG